MINLQTLDRGNIDSFENLSEFELMLHTYLHSFSFARYYFRKIFSLKLFIAKYLNLFCLVFHRLHLLLLSWKDIQWHNKQFANY